MLEFNLNKNYKIEKSLEHVKKGLCLPSSTQINKEQINFVIKNLQKN